MPARPAVVEVLLAKIIAWQFRVYGRRVLGIPFTILATHHVGHQMDSLAP